MEMAMRVGAPVIGLNDSGGARYRAYMHVYIVKIGIQLWWFFCLPDWNPFPYFYDDFDWQILWSSYDSIV